MLSYTYKYRFFCTTHNDYVEMWDFDIPKVCPYGYTHVIDETSVKVIESRVSQQVSVFQELVPTGGHYRAEARKMTIPGNSTVNETLVWNYQLSVLNVTLYSGDNGDDVVNCYIASNTPIGTLTSNSVSGSTSIIVSDSVLAYVKVGYLIHLNDGVSNNVGECIYINKDTNTITLDTALNKNYSSGCVVEMTIQNLKNFILRANTTYSLGQKTVGASSVPPGATIRLQYKNNSLLSRTFHFTFEYLF